MRTKLLVMLALLAVSLPAHPYDFAVDGIYYSFTSDGQAVTVSGGSAKDIVIPNEISYSGISYPVVAIDTKAFKGNTSISTITLGDNVTEIGEEAFYECKSLGYDQGGAYTLNLNKVKIIGARAFYLCGINYYSSHYNGRLTEVIITPSVEIIGDGAFSSCANLTTINFMAGTRTVGRMAFSNCSSLTTINFEEGAKFKSLGADAFSNTAWYSDKPGGIVYLGKYFYEYKGAMPNNSNIILDEGTLGIAPKAFFEKSGLISVSIPSSVEFIGTSAFNGCTGLTSITIPESVNSIDSYAFSGCTSLENVTLPSSISNINNNTFSGCTSLNNITIPETVTTLGNAAFSSSGLTSVAIPNSVTSMGDGVFMNCSGLKSATLPASISNIETNTFNGCSGLTTITIPSSVKTINAGAFSGCTGLTKLTLSYSLETIANTAFNGCSNIKTLTFDASKLTDYSSLNPLTAVETLTFGSHIKSIPASLISQFSSLKNVTLGSAITAIDDNVFMGKKSLETIDLKSVKTIGNHAFDGCSGLTAITFPNTVIGMGDYVLNECTGLQTVTLPAAMSEVSRGMFYGCTALTSIALPETVTVIKPLAFASSGLTSISLPASMTQVSDSVFWNCTSLAAATMPSNLESVGARAFSKTALTAVTLPTKVSSIGAGAYQQCNSLKNAKLPNSVKIVSGYLFEGCSALESVTLGNAVTDIQNYAFSGTALTQITFPATLISIGESAFRSCTGCVSISIPNKVTTIGDNAFRDCSALTSVTIGNSVVSIGKYAFAGCTGLTNLTIPANVATVGNYAFNGCSGVKTLNYRAKALETPANLSGMNNVETVNFDGGATVVPANLLPNYPKLALVNVGKDVANIAEGAFDNCDALKTMNYDAANCASGELAIASLDTLTLGTNVKSIASNMFYNCKNVKKIVCKATTPPELGNSYVFPYGKYIGVPLNMGATYKDKWSRIAGSTYTRVLPLPIYDLNLESGLLVSGKPFVTTHAYSESKAECSETGYIIEDNSNSGNKIKIQPTYTFSNDQYVYFSHSKLSDYMLPGHSYQIRPYVVVNSVEYDGYYWADIEIPALESSFNSNVGPSSIILTDNTVIPENINFMSATFTLDNKTYESYGNDIIVTGLKPNKWYSGIYSVELSEGEINSSNVNFTTPSLSFETQPVKMLTNTTAMFQAFTNLSEEETACGFLWKRYDAPEEMLGNPVNCPVYDGTMMGSLKNLPEGVYYKYRPFYRASDGSQYYGNWVAFYTGDATVEFEPVAHTYDNARVNSNNAIIQGVAIRGSKEITEQGFEYWVDGPAQSDALMASSSINNVIATGERMSSTLTGLKGNAIYSFRAYVKTADGTTYGEVRTFRTPVTAMPGDVNGDQVISGADVTALYNVLLDGSSAGGDADVNGDGVVSGADVTALYNLLLN